MMNPIDSLISFFSPVAGYKRQVAREAQQRLISITKERQEKELHERQYPWMYQAGGLTRLNKSWLPTKNKADPFNIGESDRIRNRAWDLYRNNCFARRSVDQIISRIVGAGLRPESKAIFPDGTIHTDFRHAAKALYDVWGNEAYDLGTPGRGGMTIDNLWALILKEIILSGEIIIRFRYLDARTQDQLGLEIPLTLQLINSQRLVETLSYNNQTGNGVFRGIEFDKDFRRVSYHCWNRDFWSPQTYLGSANFKQTIIPADECLHLYMPSSCEEMRGISWLAPVLPMMRDIADFQFNEILASTIQNQYALFVEHSMMGLPPTFNGGPIPSINPTGSDSNGNPLEYVEPGMIKNLGPGEKVSSAQPSHPSINAVDFMNGMLRAVSVGLPGVKSSNLTGDYRDSSFSSETAAENDEFYHIQRLQDWFFSSCCEPIWAEMVSIGLLSGVLEGEGADPKTLRASQWGGPVSRSIDPSKTQMASRLAIQNGTSSLIKECQKLNVDWKDNIDDNAIVREYAESKGVIDPLVDQWSGLIEAIKDDLQGDQAENDTDDNTDDNTGKGTDKKSGKK